jgi:hypothetical protein
MPTSHLYLFTSRLLLFVSVALWGVGDSDVSGMEGVWAWPTFQQVAFWALRGKEMAPLILPLEISKWIFEQASRCGERGRHPESRAEKYSAVCVCVCVCVFVYLYIPYTIKRRGPQTWSCQASQFVITFSHTNTVWSARPHSPSSTSV